MTGTGRVLRVGIVGAGEVSQVIHLPVLSLLSHLYTVTAICDLSRKVSCHQHTTLLSVRYFCERELSTTTTERRALRFQIPHPSGDHKPRRSLPEHKRRRSLRPHLR